MELEGSGAQLEILDMTELDEGFPGPLMAAALHIRTWRLEDIQDLEVLEERQLTTTRLTIGAEVLEVEDLEERHLTTTRLTVAGEEPLKVLGVSLALEHQVHIHGMMAAALHIRSHLASHTLAATATATTPTDGHQDPH